MKAPVKIERSDLAWSGEDTANRDREEEEQAGSNVGQDVRRLKLKSGKQKCSLPMNRSQSGIGLPHSTTLARNSGVPLRPRGRGVRQPYAAFKVSTPADFPFVGIMPLVFGVCVLLMSAATMCYSTFCFKG